MKSSLRGDFSRLPDSRRYSGVQMQQGRVQLDADWNAQGEILAHRAEAVAADLIGPAGGPHGGTGFALIPCLALGFDGRDDFVYVPNPPMPAAGAGFTFEARIAPRNGGGGTVLSRVAESRTGELDGCRLTVDAHGRLSFLQSSAVAPVAAPAPLPAGRFSHVAAVYDGTVTTLYVEGKVVASQGQGHPLAVLPSLFLIGAALLGRKPCQSFDGLIRDVRWWGVARTAAQLAGAADLRPPSGEEGLLAWWPCDEVEGSVVHDRGIRGHDGQLGAGNPASQPQRILYDLRVGAGRYYVGGVLCEQPEEVPFSAQPDYPGARLPRTPGWYLAYLDVRERFVTAAQDPGLREVALGGATTTTRTRTLAQVKLRPLAGEAELHRRDEELLAEPRPPGRLRARRRASATVLGNLLYRVEVHSSGWPQGSPVQAAEPVLAADAAARQITVARCADDAGPWQTGDRLELFSLPPAGAAPQPGPLVQITEIGQRPGVVTLSSLPAGLGTDRLQARRIATFVWSRDNASVVFPLGQLQGDTAMLLPAEGDRLTLQSGDWVTLENDPTVLQGQVLPLLQIRSVRPESFEVELSAPPPAGFDASPAAHPLLRLWNQREGPLGDLSDGALPARADEWIDLEAGIQVRFEGDSPCRAGDYWWMPARTSTEDIEWPRDAAGPLPLPPAGPEHRRAPLALVHLPTGEIHDRRRTFQPLVDGAVSKAGDTMYGPLAIRADLEVEGEARAEVLFGRLGTPGVVGTPELADGAVTTGKIAPDVGLVPPGCSLLGDSPRAPAGYVWTGASLPFPETDPEWRQHHPIPREHAGAASLVLAGGRLFALLESGEVWEIDPSGGEAPAYRSRLPSSRRSFAVAAANGRIHVLGGVDPGGRAVATHEDYDPETGRWTRRADLPVARDALAAAAVDGRIHALGGRRGSPAGERVTGTHEEYDPAGDSWQRRRPLPTPRCSLAAAVLAGRVHALAGERSRLFGRATLTVHEEYQPATDRWLRHRPPLLYPRRKLGAAGVQGQLFAVGGEGPLGGAADVQRFDPALGAWSESVPLAAPAVSPGVAGVDGTLFLAGGGKASRPGQVPVLSLTLARVFYVYRRSGG